MSFRLKTVLLFLAAGLIPYVGMMLFVLFSNQSEHVQRFNEESRRQLELAASRIDHRLESLQKELLFLARLDVMDDIVTKDIDRRISDILIAKKKDLALQGYMDVLNSDGGIIASSDFDRVGEQGSDGYLFRIPITPSFAQQPMGNLSLHYLPENLSDLLSSDEKRQLYLKENASKATLFKSRTFPRAEVMETPMQSYPGYTLCLEYDPDAALELFITLQRILIVSTLLGALVITLASAYFAARIARPVSALSRAAQSVTRSGDYTIRAEVYGNDEIAALSRSFNTMVESMDDALERLRQESQNKLRLREEKSKNEMLESLSKKLSKYLSPQIYNQIFEKKMDATLESKRKKITVFFSDIVGFTDTTENMEPEDLSTVLNHYLNEMSTIALEYGGTVDKFIGDAVMIFFGDPESKGIHEDARLCVSMALRMIRRMQELEGEWQRMGITRPFKIRIGIHTGFSTVGNFGSETRMDYTIIGGAINLASRLESISNPNEITISEETWLLVKEHFDCKVREGVSVKGINKTLSVYQVKGEKEKEERLDESFEGFRLAIEPGKADRPRVLEALRKAISRLES